MVIWFTGLSGAGKTTLASKLEERLRKDGSTVLLVDGDPFRKKTGNKNSFSRKEIIENNSRIAAHCQVLEKDYEFIIAAVISPFEETRARARRIFGENYFEIFLDCPMEILKQRDTKQLYARAVRGEVRNLIGFSRESPYERPLHPDLVIDTSELSVQQADEKIFLEIRKADDGRKSKI